MVQCSYADNCLLRDIISLCYIVNRMYAAKLCVPLLCRNVLCLRARLNAYYIQGLRASIEMYCNRGLRVQVYGKGMHAFDACIVHGV